MPKMSLVVCVHRERDFLKRLLRATEGLWDDLVVVHDGPEHDPAAPQSKVEPIDYATLAPDAPLPNGYSRPREAPHAGSVSQLVLQCGGRYFEGPRCFQQEPHWPFAWWQARHDWILRLDADEFPSPELNKWLQKFRECENDSTPGYLCVWPLWNGKKAVTQRWPAGRNFLFNRARVRFFGMVEQVPIAEGNYTPLALTLCHQPRRKSYGISNIIVRRQGTHWRRVIAESLLQTPLDLPRWRWNTSSWPRFWAALRDRPLRAGVYFLARNVALTLADQWRTERRLNASAALGTPLHHLLIALNYRRLRRCLR